MMKTRMRFVALLLRAEPVLGKTVRVKAVAARVKSAVVPARRLGAVMKRIPVDQRKANVVSENIVASMVHGLSRVRTAAIKRMAAAEMSTARVFMVPDLGGLSAVANEQTKMSMAVREMTIAQRDMVAAVG